MLISEKITLFIAAWMAVVLMLTIDVVFEIFFIFIFIGFLIVKVFSSRFTLTDIKFKINLFISMFLIIFFLLVGKKILSLLVI